MGDLSTHVIFWSGYWYLVYKEDKYWISSQDQVPVCPVGREDRLISLEDAQ